MRTLRRIVFFWVGENVEVPTLLVGSIRHTFGDEFEVIQLTDRRTPAVPGVSACRRRELTRRIMVARLEAYSSMPIHEPTLYLDADMLVVRDFDLPEITEREVGVTRRTDEAVINWHFPIDFPEFEGKRFVDEMPYIYSFVYARSEVVFVRQLTQLRKLPRRFHDWYGDQVTLKRELEADRFVVRQFDIDRYNHAVESLLDIEDMRRGEEAPLILHFKGPASKELMAHAAQRLAAAH